MSCELGALPKLQSTADPHRSTPGIVQDCCQAQCGDAFPKTHSAVELMYGRSLSNATCKEMNLNKCGPETGNKVSLSLAMCSVVTSASHSGHTRAQGTVGEGGC